MSSPGLRASLLTICLVVTLSVSGVAALWLGHHGRRSPAARAHAASRRTPVQPVQPWRRGSVWRQGGDWPMLLHDAGRSSATAERVPPPLALKWAFAPKDASLFSPIVSQDRVILPVQRFNSGPDFDYYLARLRLEDGKLEVAAELGKSRLQTESPVGSLAIGNRLVLIVDDHPKRSGANDEYPGTLVALDVLTGTRAWSDRSRIYPDSYAVEQAPLSIGQWILVSTGDTRCYDAASGKLLGKNSIIAGAYAANSRLLFVPDEPKNNEEDPASELKAFRLPHLERVWTRKGLGSPFVVTEDRIFAAQYGVYPFTTLDIPSIGIACVDMNGRTVWRHPGLDILWRYGSPMALAGQRLYVMTRVRSPRDELSYTYSTVAFDTRNGRTLWKVGITGSPAVSGDILYLRNEKGLYALRARDGKLLWHARRIGGFDLGSDMMYYHPGVIIAGGTVLVPSNHWLLALGTAGKGKTTGHRHHD